MALNYQILKWCLIIFNSQTTLDAYAQYDDTNFFNNQWKLQRRSQKSVFDDEFDYSDPEVIPEAALHNAKNTKQDLFPDVTGNSHINNKSKRFIEFNRRVFNNEENMKYHNLNTDEVTTFSPEIDMYNSKVSNLISRWDKWNITDFLDDIHSLENLTSDKVFSKALHKILTSNDSALVQKSDIFNNFTALIIEDAGVHSNLSFRTAEMSKINSNSPNLLTRNDNIHDHLNSFTYVYDKYDQMHSNSSSLLLDEEIYPNSLTTGDGKLQKNTTFVTDEKKSNSPMLEDDDHKYGYDISTINSSVPITDDSKIGNNTISPVTDDEKSKNNLNSILMEDENIHTNLTSLINEYYKYGDDENRVNASEINEINDGNVIRNNSDSLTTDDDGDSDINFRPTTTDDKKINADSPLLKEDFYKYNDGQITNFSPVHSINQTNSTSLINGFAENHENSTNQISYEIENKNFLQNNLTHFMNNDKHHTNMTLKSVASKYDNDFDDDPLDDVYDKNTLKPAFKETDKELQHGLTMKAYEDNETDSHNCTTVLSQLEMYKKRLDDIYAMFKKNIKIYQLLFGTEKALEKRNQITKKDINDKHNENIIKENFERLHKNNVTESYDDQTTTTSRTKESTKTIPEIELFTTKNGFILKNSTPKNKIKCPYKKYSTISQEKVSNFTDPIAQTSVNEPKQINNRQAVKKSGKFRKNKNYYSATTKHGKKAKWNKKRTNRYHSVLNVFNGNLKNTITSNWSTLSAIFHNLKSNSFTIGKNNTYIYTFGNKNNATNSITQKIRNFTENMIPKYVATDSNVIVNNVIENNNTMHINNLSGNKTQKTKRFSKYHSDNILSNLNEYKGTDLNDTKTKETKSNENPYIVLRIISNGDIKRNKGNLPVYKYLESKPKSPTELYHRLYAILTSSSRVQFSTKNPPTNILPSLNLHTHFEELASEMSAPKLFLGMLPDKYTSLRGNRQARRNRETDTILKEVSKFAVKKILKTKTNPHADLKTVTKHRKSAKKTNNASKELNAVTVNQTIKDSNLTTANKSIKSTLVTKNTTSIHFASTTEFKTLKSLSRTESKSTESARTTKYQSTSFASTTENKPSKPDTMTKITTAKIYHSVPTTEKQERERGVLDLIFPSSRVKGFKDVFESIKRFLSNTF